MKKAATVILTLIDLEGNQRRVEVVRGSNLRRLLLDQDFSPYTRYTTHFNCGGRGLCATCGVWIEAGAPAPVHWHDKLADKFGYPRLSCQITTDAPMTIRKVKKKVWGSSRKWKLG